VLSKISEFDDFGLYIDVVDVESEEQLRQELESKGSSVLPFKLEPGRPFGRCDDLDTCELLIMLSGRMVVDCSRYGSRFGPVELEPGDALTIPSYCAFEAIIQEPCRFLSCFPPD
jgi:hypothetical protein